MVELQANPKAKLREVQKIKAKLQMEYRLYEEQSLRFLITDEILFIQDKEAFFGSLFVFHRLFLT